MIEIKFELQPFTPEQIRQNHPACDCHVPSGPCKGDWDCLVIEP
jgi:hypothetical protein